MLKLLYVLLSECAESTLRNFRKLAAKSTPVDPKIMNDLKVDGVSVQEDFLTSQQCDEYIAKIEKIIASGSSNIWKDSAGADNRIYFAETLDDKFAEFFETPKIRQILSRYTGTEKPKGMLLASRITAKEGNLGSGGGWHRDSPISHQFKAVCYLSDVTANNGPFQFIKSSHTKFAVLKAYFNKLLKVGSNRFTDLEIEKYCSEEEKEVISFTAKKGSIIFADTKGIHRGKPLTEGKRYVLFCYFWHNEIPDHFNSLKQEEA